MSPRAGSKHYPEKLSDPEYRTKRRKVLPGPQGKWTAMGHSFFDDMKCNYCGETFREHQRRPKECPMFDLEASKAAGKIKYKCFARRKDKE